MEFEAKKETLDKIRELQQNETVIVNDKGEEARVTYILKVTPYGEDKNHGDAVAIQTTGEDWIEYIYKGEKGLQQLLKEWRTK